MINLKTAAAIAGIALAAAVIAAVFFTRSPVLIVSDNSFMRLYGETRTRRECSRISRALFRPVKIAAIADDAGDDIVQFAVEDISSRPYCVLFPFRFAEAAHLYREQNPLVPVILLEGRSAENDELGSGDCFVYKTDIDADFYRAGLTAAALDGGKNGKIAVFLENPVQTQAKQAFLKALNDLETPLETLFFTSFSQYLEISDLSCVVLAGAGSEYLEKNSGVPVIFFTWINPSLLPNDVVLVVDDSPWIQAVWAVRMAAARVEQGVIQSKFQILNEEKIGREILRKMKKPG